jgi:hypothetical protein
MGLESLFNLSAKYVNYVHFHLLPLPHVNANPASSVHGTLARFVVA